MNSPERQFYARAKDSLRADKDLPDYFVYYLTVEASEEFASAKAVEHCYTNCDLAAPSWLASHLSNGLKAKPKRFVKRNGGYRLEHRRMQEIEQLLGEGRPSIQTSAELNKLATHIPDGPKKDFLRETVICFNAGANRAAVVMCWNLAAHHLQEHILSDSVRRSAFDAALANNTDTRVKIKKVTKQDDFTEMSESKFLLFCRESKIITSSMFKKLETRLDERNAAAHPSGVKTRPKAAETYVEDLVENVLKKFPV